MSTQHKISEEALAAITREMQPTRTVEEYAQSASALYRLAMESTSASKAAAQLLLSGYNGNDWQLDITDLCDLDHSNLQHALTYLECRATLFIEPHDLFKNGSDLFVKLADRWQKLNVNNRWKRQCFECHGDGEVFSNLEDENDYSTKTCSVCGGLGLIAEAREF